MTWIVVGSTGNSCSTDAAERFVFVLVLSLLDGLIIRWQLKRGKEEMVRFAREMKVVWMCKNSGFDAAENFRLVKKLNDYFMKTTQGRLEFEVFGNLPRSLSTNQTISFDEPENSNFRHTFPTYPKKSKFR